jgi:phosphatidate phosphatase APP1
MDDPVSRGEFAAALEATYGPGDWAAATATAKKILEERGTLTAQDIHDTLKAAGVAAPPVDVLEARMAAQNPAAIPGLRRDFENRMQRHTRAARSARRN